MPDDATRRSAFIEMLPSELSSHVYMQMDSPDFDTYDKVKRWSLKYVKMKQKEKKRSRGGQHVVEKNSEALMAAAAAGVWSPLPSEEGDDDAADDDQGSWEKRRSEYALETS